MPELFRLFSGMYWYVWKLHTLSFQHAFSWNPVTLQC